MKKISGLPILVFLCAGILVSCTKTTSSTSNVTPNNVQSSMTATVGGNAWKATNYSGTNISGTLQIEGAAADGSQITLGIPATSKTGSFAAGGTNPYQATYQLGVTYYSLSTGTITITSIGNNVVSGKFSGTFTNTTTNATLAITGGAFTSSY